MKKKTQVTGEVQREYKRIKKIPLEERFLHPSRPALGPTQHLKQREKGPFPGAKAARSWRRDIRVLLWAFETCSRASFFSSG
jgi:hypothetical protein